jgi:uncharacterized RmlC-like cupin family protein
MTPILVTPEPTELDASVDGLFMHELVNTTAAGESAPGASNSVAWSVLGPGQRTRACQGDTSWTYVIVLQAGRHGLHTEGGLRMDQRRIQHPHQVLVIPPGYPHRRWNPSLTQVTTIEVRSCPSIFDDRVLLPHLDPLGLQRSDDIPEECDDRRGYGAGDGPLLLTPDPDKLRFAAHGLLVHELVNASADGNVPHSPNSVAWVRLGPGDRTRSHRHDESTAYVIVLETGVEGVDTEGGPAMTDRYTQHSGQVLVIPPGYEHRAYNPDPAERVTAIEVRSCPSVHDDRPLLPHLDHLDPLGDPRGDRRIAATTSRQRADTSSLGLVHGLG